jgi:hypothetical protein
MKKADSLGAVSAGASSWGVAAWREGDAFAELADAYYRHSVAECEPATGALERAAEYARLAAAGRGSREDWFSLLFLLDQHAEALRVEGLSSQADTVQAEAVALAEYMADNGDEEVGRMLVASAEHLSPAVLQLARERLYQPDLLSLTSLLSPDLRPGD